MKQQTDRKFYLRHFKAITHAIATYEDLNLLTKHLAEGTSRRFKAKGCSIMLLDEASNQLHAVSSYGLSEQYLRTGPIFMDDKHCAIHKGEPVWVDDMQNDLRIQYPEAAAKEGIASMLSIPIKCRLKIIGIIRVYFGKSGLIHEEDVDTLNIMAEQLGVVIENNGLKNFLEGIKSSLGSLPPRLLRDL